MHELAITESIISGIREKMADARITRVILEVGRLSTVVPDSLRFYFDICAKDTPLSGAELEIVDVPGRSRCRRCEQEAEANDFLLACPCGSLDVELISGRELLVRAVEVM